MATFGEVRGRLAQLAPGMSLDLLDGWLNDRYFRILDRLPWQRLHIETTLALNAEYVTGTVALNQGLTAVNGTGTLWTAAMTGRGFRRSGDSAYYEFTRTGDTTGTLDRPYEGATGTALGYKIFQHIYMMPADCRVLEQNAFRSFDPARMLRKITQADLDALAPHRISHGDPELWSPYMDSSTNRIQVEFYPIPTDAVALPFSYKAEKTKLGAGDTSVALVPFLREGALIAGVRADIALHLKEFNQAQGYEAQFEALLADMIRTEHANRGPSRLKMAGAFTRHRVQRWAGKTRGPVLP